MSTAQVFEPVEPVVDPVQIRLVQAQELLMALIADRDHGEPLDEATWIDRIALMERLQTSLEAAKCVAMVAFARPRAIAQVQRGIHPRKAERVGQRGRGRRPTRRLHRRPGRVPRPRQPSPNRSPRDPATRARHHEPAHRSPPGRAGRRLPSRPGRRCPASQSQRRRATKGQIMADIMVARLTGQDTADDTGYDVGIVLPLGALIDPDDPTPAEIPGMGLLPAGLARELITNAPARSWWRRLLTRPTTTGGQLIVDLDPRRRRFTGWLAELIRWRDWTCRDPYCDAPIRHLDHIQRYTDGGPTTLAGRSDCSTPTPTPSRSPPPTGHRYTSQPPQPP